MAIHFSSKKSNADRTSAIIATPEIKAIVTTPAIKTEERAVEIIRPKRQYSYQTVFEGNERRLIWEGLGEDVSRATNALEVLQMAGLDFTVEKEPIYTADGVKIPNMVVTRRYDMLPNGESLASTVFGAVSNRYQPVQNGIGFALLDALYGHNGFAVETAGQFDDGKIVWVEARLPERVMTGENIAPYIVFTNRHDGKGSVKVCLTPVRVVCRNTLNLALRKAERTFAVRHTATANEKLEAAKETLNRYNAYLDAMAEEVEKQKRMCLGKAKIDNMIETLLAYKENDTQRVKDRVLLNREELRSVYNNAPDLDGYEHSAFRFVNAVSDWATHRQPARQTANYASNLMKSTLEGNEYIDTAYRMVEAMEVDAIKVVATV